MIFGTVGPCSNYTVSIAILITAARSGFHKDMREISPGITTCTSKEWTFLKRITWLHSFGVFGYIGYAFAVKLDAIRVL